MQIINGKEVSQILKDNLKEKVELLKKEGKRLPKLVVIMVGDNPASQTYVKNKEKACEYIGFLSHLIKFNENISEEILLNTIDQLNTDDTIDGILVQLPLPKHINEEKVLRKILPEKDVDGFHPENIAKLFLNESCLTPCTPTGIYFLLNHYGYNIQGKHIVIIGRSNIVGKPAALLGLQHNATVTICHSKTENLKEICKTADILICAVGKAKFVNSEYIKDNCVVIDVGINRDENNKLCGDVDFEDVKDKVEAITPVPGGVGPMTIAMLMENTYKAYLLK